MMKWKPDRTKATDRDLGSSAWSPAAPDAVWNARFNSMFVDTSEERPLAIDVSRIHDVESTVAIAGAKAPEA